MLKTRIKASRIANLTDARYFAAREVEWLGFNLDPGTEGAVSPAHVMAFKEWVEGPKIVGEFGIQTATEIASITEALDLDAIQIGLFADAKAIHASISVPLIQEIIIEKGNWPNTLSDQVDIFLIDCMKNNVSWEELNDTERQTLVDWCENHRVILSIDVASDQLIELLEELNPYGFNMQGDEEEKVGYKSFDELDELLDVLEIEE